MYVGLILYFLWRIYETARPQAASPFSPSVIRIASWAAVVVFCGVWVGRLANVFPPLP
jgi:hypothetical protein